MYEFYNFGKSGKNFNVKMRNEKGKKTLNGSDISLIVKKTYTQTVTRRGTVRENLKY